MAPGRLSISGSAHTAEEVAALKAAAIQRINQGQAELDLGLEVAAVAASGGPMEIVGSRMGHLWDALQRCHPVRARRASCGARFDVSAAFVGWSVLVGGDRFVTPGEGSRDWFV